MKQVYILLLFIASVLSAGAQTLNAVNPGSGTQGEQALSLQISGSALNFTQGTSTQVIFSNSATGYEIYGYSFFSPGVSAAYANIDIDFAADTGLYDLTIKDDVNQLTLNDAFRVLPQLPATPTMSISPSSAATNTVPAVTVTGHLTHFLSNATFYIQLPGHANFVVGQVLQILNDSSAQVSFTLNAFFVYPGVYNFYVQDSRDNQVLSTNQFTVTGPLPQIVSAVPDSAAANTTLDINITGLNTDFSSATNTDLLWLDKNGFIIFPVQTSAIQGNFIFSQFTIPANAPNGYYDIHTYDPVDGELVKPNGFYIYNGVSGIADVNADMMSVQVFPNPSINNINVAVNMESEQWVSISVSDIAGQIIMSKRVLLIAGKSNTDIDVSLFANGVYTINLNSAKRQLHTQFAVVH